MQHRPRTSQPGAAGLERCHEDFFLLLRGTILMAIRTQHIRKSLTISAFLVSRGTIVSRTKYCQKKVNSKWDQTLSEKRKIYVGFCVYRRSYLLWYPVILTNMFVLTTHVLAVLGTRHTRRKNEHEDLLQPPYYGGP